MRFSPSEKKFFFRKSENCTKAFFSEEERHMIFFEKKIFFLKEKTPYYDLLQVVKSRKIAINRNMRFSPSEKNFFFEKNHVPFFPNRKKW